MNYVKYIRDRVGHDVINLTGVNVLILNENDEVLLQRRGTFPFKWGLVGGITELGESLEETAVREAKEETGLDITKLNLLGITSGEECYIDFPNGDKEDYGIGNDYRSQKLIKDSLDKLFMSNYNSDQVDNDVGYYYTGTKKTNSIRFYLIPMKSVDDTTPNKSIVFYTHYENKWGKDVS